MTTNASLVFDQLLRVDELAQEFDKNSTTHTQQDEQWRGIIFMLNGNQVISSTSEVSEIIEVPGSLTKVPNTAPWMMGLTNFHGESLPVTDLQHFVSGTATEQDYKCKVLVIRNRGKYLGLLVPAVLGLRHIPDEFRSDYVTLEDRLDVFIYEQFDFEDQILPLVNIAALIGDTEFLMQ